MDKEIKINFFGDSICFGQGVSIIHGWVPRIAGELNRIFNEKKFSINIANNAVNGRTTRQALESMPYEIQSSSPDLLIIQFGMNDCNYWATDNGVPRVNINSFKNNLIEIIDRAKTFNVSQIILNTNHPTTRNTPFEYADCSYQDSNERYNQMIREVSNEIDDITLNDIEKDLNLFIKKNKESLSSFLLDDELHLSIKGHDFYYKATLALIKDSIEGLIEI